MVKKFNSTKLKEIIGFYPHPKQQEILMGMNQFTVVVGARRLGKSMLAAYLALKELFQPERSVWVVAPTHDLASRIWEYLDKWIDNHFSEIFIVNKHEKIIENKMTHSKLWAKTAESQTSLRGKGLDLVILDEASLLPKEVWEGNIQPNLMDRGAQGRAFFISNPYGFNWFYDIFQYGTPEGRFEHPEWMSFQMPLVIEDADGNVIGTNNPQISVDTLKSKKKTTPPDVWRQEYLSVFQEGSGQRIKNIEPCIDENIRIEDVSEWFEDPIPGHLYFLGCDIAKVEDFTVVCVVDRMTHRLVGFYRVNNLSWAFMRAKVKSISEKYENAEIILDATGNGGDQFAEDLSAIGANVDTKFVYTNKTKNLLVDKLAILVDRKLITFPRIPQLIMELKSFTYHFSPSGNMILGSSKKDDCLNALALACWKLNDEPLGGDSGASHLYVPRRQRYG